MIVEQKMSKKKLAKLSEISLKTLNEVRDKLETRARVLVVRPTGFGKSHMLAELTSTKNEDGTLKYKKCLFVYPTDIIMQSMIVDYGSDKLYNKNIKTANLPEKRVPGDEHGLMNDNTDFRTYKYFTNRVCDIEDSSKDYSAKDLKDFISQYDLIMFDECHSVGAEGFQKTWQYVGRAVTANTKIVGVTATPNRKDGIDILEIFGKKNKVSDYTLDNAIKDGILAKFDYVYTTLDSDKLRESAFEYADSTRKKITKLKFNELTYIEKSELLQDETKMDLAYALKSMVKLPIADGEKEVHVGKSNYAKFVIFANNRNQIHKSLKSVVNAFESVYSTMNVRKHIILTKVSDDEPYKVNGEELEVKGSEAVPFILPTDNTIDLIFSVDMLTMGYHVDNITGVILLNNTTSAVKYNQQIGRCFSIRNNNKPIIFDIRNTVTESPLLADKVENAGDKVDLTDKLSESSLDKFDFTKTYVKKVLKLTRLEYNKSDAVLWLYVNRHMPIKEIQNNFRVNNKKVKISLELIVKILIKNGVYIHDMEYVLDNKDQIKDEAVLNRLESMSDGD